MSPQLEYPYNFSWVIKDLLCGMGFPSRPIHFKTLYNKGVRGLISLTHSGMQIDMSVVKASTPSGLE